MVASSSCSPGTKPCWRKASRASSNASRTRNASPRSRFTPERKGSSSMMNILPLRTEVLVASSRNLNSKAGTSIEWSENW